MPAQETASSRPFPSEPGDGGPSAELDAALRALHTATIHLNESARFSREPLLVARSRALVHQATELLTAASRLGEPAER